jgi:hypothetical protein
MGHIQCCWTKSGNLAVGTALAGPSKTSLSSWFNSCATTHALARMGCLQSEQMTGYAGRARGLKPRALALGPLVQRERSELRMQFTAKAKREAARRPASGM